MKKSLIAMMAAAAFITACSGDGKPTRSGLSEYSDAARPGADSDSLTVRPDSVVLPPVTSQGIGPMRLGMDPSALPLALMGVYDSVSVSQEVWDDESFTAIECFLDSVKTVEALAMAAPKRIDAITVTGGDLSLNVNGERLRVGSPAKRLGRMPGVHKLPESSDGALRYEWHGVTIYAAADTIMAFTLGEE